MEDLRNLVNESLGELVKYIQRAKPEIEEMANSFYAGSEQEGIAKIPLLLEGMGWISEVLGHAVHFQSDAFPVELLQRSLHEELLSIKEALENQDWVLFGDLLQYQLIPLLEQLEEGAPKAFETL